MRKQTMGVLAGAILLLSFAAAISMATANPTNATGADTAAVNAQPQVQAPSCCGGGAMADSNGDGLCDACGMSIDKCGSASCSAGCHAR